MFAGVSVWGLVASIGVVLSVTVVAPTLLEELSGNVFGPGDVVVVVGYIAYMRRQVTMTATT